ncbi:alpha/beta hydrolase, partial [Megasphaera sp.]
MSAIKTELAAFIAAHTSEDFIMTPITMREASLHTAWEQELPKVPMASVVDTVLDGCEVYDVPVRIYIPDTSRPLPVLIYYHGGGFAIDTVAVYDPVCRRIAQATQHIVISPEYRLAPENPYPAAYEDALAVARKALPALDALQIPYQADLTLCGDSAGGCMAAYTSQALQHDASLPLTHQILVYPCLDMTHSFPSVQENCNTRTGFTPAKMTWYFNQCFRPGDDRRDASPLFGELSADMPAT